MTTYEQWQLEKYGNIINANEPDEESEGQSIFEDQRTELELIVR